MSKIIVTHLSPDLDAIASSWLIKNYLPCWEDAEFKFVPAGTTWEDKGSNDNPNILHVDTGLGKFDHHQVENRALCAAKLVFNFLVKKKHIRKDQYEALSRIIDYVVMDDNFADIFLHEPDSDIYDFCLHRLIDGIKGVKRDDYQRMDFGFQMLDASLQNFMNKIRAEKEIKNGLDFQSHWGKSLAMETKVTDAVKLALKKGYQIVIKKDPERQYVSIKTLPVKKLDLTPIYERLKKQDPQATWFLHVSKNMLLNGSTKNPKMIPTSLSLKKVIEIIKSI